MLTLLLACTSERPAIVSRPSGERSAEPVALCINEFMAANLVSVLDDEGVSADWIELHNPTNVDVSLDGWSLTDDPGEPDKHRLPGGLVVEAGGFLVLWADGTPDRGPTHLGFSLSEDGEAIGLYAPDGSGTVVRYGKMVADLAVARTTDCCFDGSEACFVYTFGGTPGATNGE